MEDLFQEEHEFDLLDSTKKCNNFFCKINLEF